MTKEVQHISIYNFDKQIDTPEILLNKIEAIYNENIIFKQEFEKVTLIHQNNLSALVPSPLFNEKELRLYLNYNIKTLTNDFIAYDTLSLLDVKNVYVPYVNINNFFFQKFGEFEYKHHTTVLIDKLILYCKNTPSKHYFVNVTNNNFDIVIIEDSKLLFYNTFSFVTKEDFIYYILFTAEQLKLNPEEFQLTFIGDIEKESELYLITYQYIRNINFLEQTNSIFNSEQEISKHANYITLP